ncbi:E3 ubiquitin-protein ligase mib1 [Tyrophagus putrescentiae]|nr:E3 ubiquitin-protein ligase mib1 [Tyrophagus putrescentiae]
MLALDVADVVGARVIRNRKHWKWSKQDGGDGHLGTIRQVNQLYPGEPITVVIAWDNGTIANYRPEDVHLVDTGPCGVRHESAICDSCHHRAGIFGIRWQCAVCINYDLCSQCYHTDQHNVKHHFYRIDSPLSDQRRTVGSRKGAKKVPLKGILPGAKVVRGIDWTWENQDGGKKGRVEQIQEWNEQTGNSAALVIWSTGQTDLYRVGHRGMVDLKVVTVAKSHSVYRDHLPLLTEYENAYEDLYSINDWY